MEHTATESYLFVHTHAQNNIGTSVIYVWEKRGQSSYSFWKKNFIQILLERDVHTTTPEVIDQKFHLLPIWEMVESDQKGPNPKSVFCTCISRILVFFFRTPTLIEECSG